jgi:hypothetical protein
MRKDPRRPRITAWIGPRSHSLSIVKAQNAPVVMEAVCTFCGKSVLPEVREGENLFHLYCFVLYKRRIAAEEAEAAQ